MPAPPVKITVLGSGTSVGVPTIGCHCAVCTSTDPRDNRLRPSVLLSYDGHNVLIDTTPDFRTQALRAGIERLNAVIFTHAHADHMMASMLTTAAFHWSGQPKRYPGAGDPYKAKRLYYVTTNFVMPDRHPAMMMPWTVTLDIRSVRERKNEAFRKHVSQAPLMEKTKEIFERYGAEELYALAATSEPQVSKQQTDLFEALT